MDQITFMYCIPQRKFLQGSIDFNPSSNFAEDRANAGLGNPHVHISELLSL